jgi:spore germination cell wall hydrolase CwlJ-like protein
MAERKIMKHLPNICKSIIGNYKLLLFVFLGVLPMGAFNIHTATAQELNERKIPAYAMDIKQIKCMATNIFYEARGESEKGKAAVGRVVMNRVKHGFAPNPCAVVYQKTTNTDTKVTSCQFSWVCEGKRNLNTKDPKYKESEQIAYEVLALNQHKNVIPSSILFFHNTSVKPDIKYKTKIQIGNHIFYEHKKRKS